MTLRKTSWLFDHRDQTFDYDFIGSSLTNNTVDIQFVVFDKWIRSGNRIHKRFIQVDAQGLDAPRHFSFRFHHHLYIPYLPTDPALPKLNRENADRNHNLLWRYIPFSKYIEFNPNTCRPIMFRGRLMSEIKW